MAEQYKDIVGQPIPGMPDCYAAGPGDSGYPQGSICKPQGDDGPVFQKEARQDREGRGRLVWVHIAGNVAPLSKMGLVRSLKNLFESPQRRKWLQQQFGPPAERSRAIQQQFGVPQERRDAIEREFGPPRR